MAQWQSTCFVWRKSWVQQAGITGKDPHQGYWRNRAVHAHLAVSMAGPAMKPSNVACIRVADGRQGRFVPPPSSPLQT